MPEFFPSLSDKLRDWAMAQPVFFIASAPKHGQHVNCSPKGYAQSNFAVLGPNLCAYVDRTGSGCETIAHLYENGRATLMFCSFGSRPRIMRLFCRGRVVEWNDPAFPTWLEKMGLKHVDAARSILVFDIVTVQTSCGYGVPMVRKEMPEPTAATDEEALSGLEKEKRDLGVAGFQDRQTLLSKARMREEQDTVYSYQDEVNLTSLDGLPGLRAARRRVGHWAIVDELAIRTQGILAEKQGMALGFFGAIMLYCCLRLVVGLQV